MQRSLPRDIRAFLENYPENDEDDKSIRANLEFYSNKRRCQPDGVLVNEIHERWKGNYMKLEYKHGYIQWLFPIREYGVNYEAQPLQLHEREAMRADKQMTERILQSYRVMLDFYGMQLISTETGLLARAEPERKYIDRYRNLTRAQHNNLRISRILKCLSEMGLERLNAGFVLHVLNEQSEHDELNTAAIKSSMDNWWANCIRDTEEREWLGKLIREVREDDLVFTRDMYEKALERRKRGGSFLADEDAATIPADEENGQLVDDTDVHPGQGEGESKESKM